MTELPKQPPKLYRAGFNTKITTIHRENGYVHIEVNTRKRHADVLRFLAKLDDEEYATTWEIGEGTGYSVREIRNTLKYLESAGSVKRHYTRRPDGSFSRIPRYGLFGVAKKMYKVYAKILISQKDERKE